MEGIGLVVFCAVLVVIAGTWVSRLRRSRRWPAVPKGVHCPLHGYPADVTVRTDPDAASSLRHKQVVACSLLSDAAVALPERRAYLADTPACAVVLEAARAHPVYATVSCRQPCLHVLNAAASVRPLQPLACASGVSDGIELMRQADPHATGCRSFWYTSS